MKALFKKPVKVEGKLFGKGLHDLSEKEASHWYIKAMVKSGDISFPQDKPKPAAPALSPAAEKLKAEAEEKAKAKADAEAEKLKADEKEKAEAEELAKMEAEEAAKKAQPQPQKQKGK